MTFVSNKLVAAFGNLSTKVIAKGRAICVSSTPADDSSPFLRITNVHNEQLSRPQSEELAAHIESGARGVRMLNLGLDVDVYLGDWNVAAKGEPHFVRYQGKDQFCYSDAPLSVTGKRLQESLARLIEVHQPEPTRSDANGGPRQAESTGLTSRCQMSQWKSC